MYEEGSEKSGPGFWPSPHLGPHRTCSSEQEALWTCAEHLYPEETAQVSGSEVFIESQSHRDIMLCDSHSH